MYKKTLFERSVQYFQISGLLTGIFLIIQLLYWFNWIPPVPPSLKFGGIYHHASRDAATGLFTLKLEKPEWYQVLKSSDDVFHYNGSDTVCCFSAVFAPSELKEKIYHHWQVFNPEKEEWLSTDRLGFQIVGYRDSGYRGVTRKRNVAAGRWRVDVETDEGALLKRLSFEVKHGAELPELKSIQR